MNSEQSATSGVQTLLVSEPVRWHRVVLRAAAVYNIVWGTIAILAPQALFRWVALEPLPNYPEFWQCIGMIIGVYGVGYWIAAGDPVRHWPIVFVGLAGKILGPIGFLQAVLNERFPPAMGLTILTNDLIWWLPFGLILAHVRKHGQVTRREPIVEEPVDAPRLVPGSRREPRPAIVWSSLTSNSDET